MPAYFANGLMLWFREGNCWVESAHSLASSIQVRLWDSSTGECVQSITHPSTVWACTTLPNGDLASGCADGNAYVWTRSPSRMAHPDALTAFKECVAAVAMPAQTMSDEHALDTSKLPGEEALVEPGQREVTPRHSRPSCSPLHAPCSGCTCLTTQGQLKVVKEESTGTPMAYQWSNASRSWEKIGEVVGGKDQGGGGATMGKRMFDGKEWECEHPPHTRLQHPHELQHRYRSHNSCSSNQLRAPHHLPAIHKCALDMLLQLPF